MLQDWVGCGTFSAVVSVLLMVLSVLVRLVLLRVCKRSHYSHVSDIYRLGSRKIYRQTTDFYIGSHATLQGYSASHYTFSVYIRPFLSTCEVTVHSVAPLMAYSHEYTEHLWTNGTKALHVTSIGPTCFCTSR